MRRSPHRSIGLLLVGVLAFAASSSTAGAAAGAPSLSLETDAEPPHLRWGIAADPIGWAAGELTALLEVAPHRAHGLWAELGWMALRADDAAGLGLLAGYHLWPLGGGLAGPFLGPAVGVVVAVPSRRVVEVTGGFEAGYQVAAAGVALAGYVRWLPSARLSGSLQVDSLVFGVRLGLALP